MDANVSRYKKLFIDSLGFSFIVREVGHMSKFFPQAYCLGEAWVKAGRGGSTPKESIG
jgi:hypothetical protein